MHEPIAFRGVLDAIGRSPITVAENRAALLQNPSLPHDVDASILEWLAEHARKARRSRTLM
jgi:hypothetical protein